MHEPGPRPHPWFFNARRRADAILTPKRRDGSGPAASLPWVLRRFWIRSVAAFVAMILLAYLESWAGDPGQRFGPLVDPLFGDLLEYRPTFRLIHTLAFYLDPTTPRVAYPPLGAVLFVPLYAGGHPVTLYLGIAAAWLGGCIAAVRHALIAWRISPTVATLFPTMLALACFPIEGLLQRGNLELFVWILAASGSFAFLRGHDRTAAILWGLAAAMKLFPILLLALFLPRRRLLAFLLGVGTFVSSSLLALWFLGPTVRIAWAGSLRGVFGYQGVRAAEWSAHELSMNHSAFGLVKVAAVLAGHPAAALTVPYLTAGGLLFAMLFFARLRHMPEANQLLAASVFMVTFPPVSYFYTLVHLEAPFVVLVFLALRADRSGVRIAGLSTSLQLFVPLFASFTLFTFRKIDLYGGPIQALFLLALFTCAVCFPFQLSYPQEAGTEGRPEEDRRVPAG